MAIIKKEEYRDYDAINQSKAKLIVNPLLYKNYSPPEDDGEEKDHLRFGSFQDELLLASDDIWDKYIVCNVEKPTASLLDLANACYKNDIIAKEDIAQKAIDMNLWGNIKKPEVLVKRFDNKLFWDYMEFLSNSEGKSVLTDLEYDLALHNFNNLHYSLKDRMAKVCLTGEYKGMLLKGELDYLYINHDLKTWRVEDLKSTADVANFDRSILKWRYDFQIPFYEYLVEQNRNLLGIPADYCKVPGRWHVVSNAIKMANYTYINVWDSWKSFWENGRYYMGVQEALDRLHWHNKENKWEYPLEHYKDGFLSPKTNVRYEPEPINTNYRLEL